MQFATYVYLLGSLVYITKQQKISFSLFICFKLDIESTVYTIENVFYVFWKIKALSTINKTYLRKLVSRGRLLNKNLPYLLGRTSFSGCVTVTDLVRMLSKGAWPKLVLVLGSKGLYCLETRPRDSCRYPSCCENWFYRRRKETKIAMQLSISKYSDFIDEERKQRSRCSFLFQNIPICNYMFLYLYGLSFSRFCGLLKRALRTKWTFPKDPPKQQALTLQHTSVSVKQLFGL